MREAPDGNQQGKEVSGFDGRLEGSPGCGGSAADAEPRPREEGTRVPGSRTEPSGAADGRGGEVAAGRLAERWARAQGKGSVEPWRHSVCPWWGLWRGCSHPAGWGGSVLYWGGLVRLSAFS